MPDRNQHSFMKDTKKIVTRRDILKAGFLGGLLLPLLASPVRAASRLVVPSSVGAMKISFRNQHTGESFNGVYRVGDRYLPESFAQINTVLRDFRTGEVFPVDPRLFDILYMARNKLGGRGYFEVLSGYRSPKTNAQLARNGDGVAQNSLHMTGQAIDVRLPGYSTRKLFDLAGGLKAGGAGYYKKSNFVHLDTGKVRHWS